MEGDRLDSVVLSPLLHISTCRLHHSGQLHDELQRNRIRFPRAQVVVLLQGVAEFDHERRIWEADGPDSFEWGPTYPILEVLAPGSLRVTGLGSEVPALMLGLGLQMLDAAQLLA